MTTDKPEMHEPSSSDSLCKICNIKKFVYVCPRCNLNYCSVECYRSNIHLQCSESFYKECIEEEIKSREDDPVAKTQMMNILKNYQSAPDKEEEMDSDDDDDDDCDIAERLKGIDLNDPEAVWESLTDEEKKEFTEMVKSGDITNLVPIWTPWWTQKYQRKKVKFLNEEDEDKYKEVCPPIGSNIPPFSTISKTKPSEFVENNLKNALAAYVLCSRYYNGEQNKFSLEAATAIINISKNLCKNQIFDSAETALASVCQEAIANHFINVQKDDLEVMKSDVESLLEGPNKEDNIFYVQAALNDMRILFLNAKHVLKTSSESKAKGKFSKQFSDTTSEGVDLVSKDVIMKSIKKLEYYMSWANEYLKIVDN